MQLQQPKKKKARQNKHNNIHSPLNQHLKEFSKKHNNDMKLNSLNLTTKTKTLKILPQHYINNNPTYKLLQKN